MCLRVLTLLSTCFLMTHSYKILALFPHPGKSHVDVFLPLTKALARKGHQVTVISYFPLKEPIENYLDISVESERLHLIDVLHMDQIQDGKMAKWLQQIQHLEDFAIRSCAAVFESKAVQEFLHSQQTFDVIMAEFFNSDCLLGFVGKFKAPLIGISSCTIMHWTNERLGNPTHPAFIPNNLMDYSDRLSFLQRVENVLVGIFHQLYFTESMARNDQMVTGKYFGDDAVPPLADIVLNSSLLLVNTHFSLSLPRPLVPAVIEIGGIHIDKVGKLPDDLEKWISESPQGVIYFSLGSMIKGHTFPEDKRAEFLRAFSRLPQRVLWKWENETMPGKPENVMIKKWMPQLDILCHPNVKAFISHGGLLGTTEAVHCGVPVLVMPQYGDQHTNARALEANGGGVILYLRDADEEKVYNALRKILDPEFSRGAQELSARFRDRPLPPLETAIYWVEYVARHRGARHMRTAAVDMPLYKYLLLDVIAFLLAVAAALGALLFCAARAVFRKIRGPATDKQKTN